jgi:MFS family permease
LLQGSAGVGALIAGVSLMLRTGLRGLGRRTGVGTTVLGLGLTGLALSRSPLLSCVALALVGFGYLTQTASAMTLLQGLAPDEMRGRVMGLFSTLFVGVTPFGALAGGFAASRFGAPRVVLVGSLFVLAASAVFHAALPALRRTVLAQYPTLFPPQVP